MTATNQILPLKKGADTRCLLTLLNKSVVKRIRLYGVDNRNIVEEVVVNEVKQQSLSGVKAILNDRTANLSTVIEQIKNECTQLVLSMRDQEILEGLLSVVKLEKYSRSVRQFCDRIRRYSEESTQANKTALMNMVKSMLHKYSFDEITYDYLSKGGNKDVILLFTICVTSIVFSKRFFMNNIMDSHPATGKIMMGMVVGMITVMALTLYMAYRVKNIKRIKLSAEEIDHVFGEVCVISLIQKNEKEFSMKYPLLTDGFKKLNFFKCLNEIDEKSSVVDPKPVTIRRIVVSGEFS